MKPIWNAVPGTGTHVEYSTAIPRASRLKCSMSWMSQPCRAVCRLEEGKFLVETFSVWMISLASSSQGGFVASKFVLTVFGMYIHTDVHLVCCTE